MTTLSSSLAAVVTTLAAFEEQGVALEADAVRAICKFLRGCADDAAKLERMLERRLTSAHLPAATQTAPPIDLEPSNLVLFVPKGRAAPRSGGDAA